jgi:hypothetical protein
MRFVTVHCDSFLIMIILEHEYINNTRHFTIRHLLEINMDRKIRDLHCKNNASYLVHNKANALNVNDRCSPTDDAYNQSHNKLVTGIKLVGSKLKKVNTDPSHTTGC